MEKIIEQRVVKKTRRKTYPEYLLKWKDHPVEDSSWVIELDILKHGKKCRSSWIGVHEYFIHRSMMQEHHLQSQICEHGGKDRTSQHDGNFKSTINSEINELLRYFGNDVFKYVMFVKSCMTVRSYK
jgi:hypothetical protein